MALNTNFQGLERSNIPRGEHYAPEMDLATAITTKDNDEWKLAEMQLQLAKKNVELAVLAREKDRKEQINESLTFCLKVMLQHLGIIQGFTNTVLSPENSKILQLARNKWIARPVVTELELQQEYYSNVAAHIKKYVLNGTENVKHELGQVSMEHSKLFDWFLDGDFDKVFRKFCNGDLNFTSVSTVSEKLVEKGASTMMKREFLNPETPTGVASEKLKVELWPSLNSTASKIRLPSRALGNLATIAENKPGFLTVNRNSSIQEPSNPRLLLMTTPLNKQKPIQILPGNRAQFSATALPGDPPIPTNAIFGSTDLSPAWICLRTDLHPNGKPAYVAGDYTTCRMPECRKEIHMVSQKLDWALPATNRQTKSKKRELFSEAEFPTLTSAKKARLQEVESRSSFELDIDNERGIVLFPSRRKPIERKHDNAM